jgi:DNA-binding response OmpR family regulator
VKVLLVDDQQPMRMLCRVNLELEGLDVSEAADGRAAIETARAERPDVILLDLMLPALDGWAVADELASDPATAGIPIVLLTAVGDRRLHREGLEAGALACLTKPFDPVGLAGYLREVAARAAAGESAALRDESLAAIERAQQAASAGG